MTHSGSDGAAPPPSGAPWWDEEPSPAGREPGGDGEATELIPQVPGMRQPGDDGESTELIPQVPAGDGEATQFIPPVPGAQFGPPPVAQPPFAQPPVAPPPAARHAAPAHTQFDDLFRDSAGPSRGDPAATQQLPHLPAGPPPGRHDGGHGGAPGGPYGHREPGRYHDDDEPRGSIPRWAGVAIGTAVCAAIGVTAGYLLSSGDDGSTASGATPSASVSKDEQTGKDDHDKPPPDPAKAQAEKLDTLLADSNNSRDAVVRSVGNIRQCKALGKAAADLRGAAKQRSELVTRLRDLKVDKLENSGRLTSSLTAAWKASAAADNHYAAWADQIRKQRACPGGQARTTGHTRAGNAASGDATRAKQEAASLWNAIARKYDLTKHQATQL